MNNIQKYDAWLHWDITAFCNMSCSYCFARRKKRSRLVSSMRAKAQEIIGSSNHIDIESALRTLSGTGKIFRISFTGGEPFLVKNFIEIGRRLSEGHYIGLNTNCTSARISEFAESIDPDRVFSIVASLHIHELERLKLLNRYVTNFHKLKSKGFRILAQEVAYPLLDERCEYYVNYFKSLGIELNFVPFTGEFAGKRYPENYTELQLRCFNLPQPGNADHFGGGIRCNAGYNAATILTDGTVVRCLDLRQKIGNIFSGINFEGSMFLCPKKTCGCPVYLYDRQLYTASVTKSAKSS